MRCNLHALLSLPLASLFVAVCLPTPAIAQSAEDVQKALADYNKAVSAAATAQTAADDAKKNVTKKEDELKELKGKQTALQEKLDADKTISRLEMEIEAIEKELKIIDKVRDKVLFKFLNRKVESPPLTTEENAVRVGAFGGNSVSAVSESIKQQFADRKAKLEKDLKAKKEKLDKAKKDAKQKKLSDAERQAAQAELDDLETKIKAKETEIADAKTDAATKATKAKAAKAAETTACEKYDKLRQAKATADALQDAKTRLEKALEAVRKAAKDLKDEEADLKKNFGLAKLFSDIFNTIGSLLNALDKISDVLSKIGIDTNFTNPDVTGALSQGAKILDAIDKLLNDKSTTLGLLIKELLEGPRDRLKKALEELRKAEQNLKALTTPKKLGQANSQGRRMAMLESPHSALVRNTSRQLYAAAEHALDQGNVAGLARVQASIRNYRDEANQGAFGLDQIDVQEASLLAGLMDEVEMHRESLASQVGAIEGNQIPAANMMQANGVSNPHFSSRLRSITWEALGDEMLRQRNQAMTTAGSMVLKGNAVSTSGGSAPTMTLSLAAPPMQNAPTIEKTVNVEIDENGDFEAKVDPGWTATRIRMGGPNATTTTINDPINSGLPGAPPWRNPSLSPESQQLVMLNFDRFERLYAATMTGQPQSNRAPSEAAALRGWRILGVVEGGQPPLNQMPNLANWKSTVMLGSTELYTLDSSESAAEVLTVVNNPPPVVAIDNSASEDGLQVFKVNSLNGDESAAQTLLPAIAERVTIVHQVALPNETSQWAPQLQELSNTTLQATKAHVVSVVGAGSVVEVKLIDQQTMYLPGSGRQTAGVAFTYQVVAQNGDGESIQVDRKQLQAKLDADDSLPIAGVMLPREAQATPADPFFKSKGSWGETYHDQWALRRAGFVAPNGQGVWPDKLEPCTVAVIGSGVDWTHPELAGQVWINDFEDPYNGVDDDNNGYVDDVFGWNFRDENSNVLDLGGHDTHIAGVIAARWNDRGMAGANPAARIMALKVANYLGQADSVSISRAIHYAVKHRARVINISYNGKTPSAIEESAIEYAANRGVLVVVSSGNQGVDAKSLALSNSPNVLTVAGSDTKDGRAGFSNFGQPIDMTAPAMDVLGLRAHNTDFLLYTGGASNYAGGAAIVAKERSLYRASGTSFAAPLVTGAASLILSQQPTLSGQQVRQMLLMSADDVTTPGWDQNTGVGVVNAGRAMQQSPDQFLLVRIFNMAAARRNNEIVVEVSGDLEASNEEVVRTLQVAFGEKPSEDDWKNVATLKENWKPGSPLGEVSASEFNKRGVWSIRVVAKDGDGVERQAHATITIQ